MSSTAGTWCDEGIQDLVQISDKPEWRKHRSIGAKVRGLKLDGPLFLLSHSFCGGKSSWWFV